MQTNNQNSSLPQNSLFSSNTTPQQQQSPFLFSNSIPQQQQQNLFVPYSIPQQQQQQNSLFSFDTNVQQQSNSYGNLFGINSSPSSNSNVNIFNPPNSYSVNPPPTIPVNNSSPFQQYSQLPTSYPSQYSQYPQAPQQIFGYSNYAPSPFWPGQQNQLENIPYNDDEQIKTRTLDKKTAQGESKIQLKLFSQYNQVQMGVKRLFPSLCSIKGYGGSRANVDIICVIDISGSMSGSKIDFVRKTMMYVLEMLTENDRLSIVVYDDNGKRLTPLKVTDSTNQNYFKGIIQKLQAGGGNIMLNGLQVAVKILRERKSANEVTSIFLLSDGQEPHDTDRKFKEMLDKNQNRNIGSFSLHSFGFGSDHDEVLMTKVCSLKDGNFYYIEKLSSLDEAFCNALGGIITQTASDIQIELQKIASPPVQAVSIEKVYGDKWTKVNEKKYKISINQIMADVSKDFIFQLLVPSINFEVLDINRSFDILRGNFTAKGNNGQKIHGEAILRLQFIQSGKKIDEKANSQVVESYYRVKAAQTITEAIKLAESAKYDQASRLIDDVLETVKYHPNIRKQKVKGLLQDLELAKQKCKPNTFQNSGKKQMMNIWYSNTNQCSYQFSNPCQQQMLGQLRKNKKS